MSTFDSLNEHFEHTFAAAGLNAPNELQEKVLQRTKQGGDLLLVSGKETGKSMAAALAALQKVPESCEGSPRAVIICTEPEKARTIAKFIATVSRRKELMVELADDKGQMIGQRNNIYEGADIVIGNPKRIFDLYIQNGINFGKLKLFVLDDAETMLKEATIGHIRRIAGSLPKCQRMIFAGDMNPKLEKILDDVLINPLIIENE